MSSRTPVFVLLATAGGVAAFAGYQAWSSGGLASPAPIDAAPRDSFLVADVDVAGLRASPLGDVLELAAGPRSGAIAATLGLGGTQEACGFEVLDRVDRLVVAVPEAEGQDEIGVAGKVRITADEARRCAERLVDGRGGAATTRSVGRFHVLEDGAQGKAGSARPRIAFHPSGLVLVSRGPWLDAMLDAAEGRAARLDASAQHATVRKALTSGAGNASPTALVSVVLPKALRERVRTEAADEAERERARAEARDDAGLPPAPRDASATLRAVLGVNAAGASVSLPASSAGETPVRVRALLVCETAEDCAGVARVVEEKRASWGRHVALRLAGLGGLVDSLELKAEGATLQASATTSGETLARAARFFRGAAGLGLDPPKGGRPGR